MSSRGDDRHIQSGGVGWRPQTAEPRRSVLNAHSRAHNVENLWVLDGASFTSYKEKNPTLTVIAVALRAAHHLGEALRRGDV